MTDTLRQLLTGLRALLVLTVLLGIAYPVAVWGIGQTALPDQAERSLIVTATADGRRLQPDRADLRRRHLVQPRARPPATTTPWPAPAPTPDRPIPT